jgi:hypothetical protein
MCPRAGRRFYVARHWSGHPVWLRAGPLGN